MISAILGVAAAGFAPSASGYQEQSSRPQAGFEKTARILALDSDVKEDSFRYNYETENGIKAEEQGREVRKQPLFGGYRILQYHFLNKRPDS